MNPASISRENIKEIPFSYVEILKNIINKLHTILKGKREVMYSDIINLIIREGYFGEGYKQLILWCNYKIRLGETFVELK